MNEETQLARVARRTVLIKGAHALAAIAVVVVAPVGAVFAKAKSAKDDFFFQETPDEDTGRKCTGCINFTPKSTGQFGPDSGDCALLEGDVCNHCYCQGWTDKNKPGVKKANS